MAKLVRVDAPGTYICVGGKMVPMIPAEVDKKDGTIKKYHADISKAIDRKDPDAELKLLRAENADLQRKVDALAGAINEMQAGEAKSGQKSKS